MIRFVISKRHGRFWAWHSINPEFCRSYAERARGRTHTPAICYSAAYEKWVGGDNSDSFLRDKFPGHKNHIWSSLVS